MNFDDMNIPQFGVSTPIIDTLQSGMIFIGLGIVFGIAATAINNRIVKNTVEVFNYKLGEHFISEVKRINS